MLIDLILDLDTAISDFPYFDSKTFGMPKKSKFTVDSIPAVSTTE